MFGSEKRLLMCFRVQFHHALMPSTPTLSRRERKRPSYMHVCKRVCARACVCSVMYASLSLHFLPSFQSQSVEKTHKIES